MQDRWKKSLKSRQTSYLVLVMLDPIALLLKLNYVAESPSDIVDKGYGT